MKRARILYVDDEPDIREIASMSLELDPQLDVRTCACGQDALETAREWQPDLILLDAMMPEMDGPQTLAALKAKGDTSGISVVFITARTQTSEVEHFIELGAVGVIAKPFDPMGLAGLVQQYLQKPDA
nr:response regulator [Afifella sp. H1R]